MSIARALRVIAVYSGEYSQTKKKCILLLIRGDFIVMPAITNKTITITCDTDGAEIRYEYQYGSGSAEDCPEPTNNSTLYT